MSLHPMHAQHTVRKTKLKIISKRFRRRKNGDGGRWYWLEWNIFILEKVNTAKSIVMKEDNQQKTHTRIE